MATKEKDVTPEVEAARAAAGTAAPNPADSKKVQAFLDEFGSTPKQIDEMRAMIESGASVDTFVEKFRPKYNETFAPHRYFRANVEKVLKNG